MYKKKVPLPSDDEIISKKVSFSSFVDDVILGKTEIIKKNQSQVKLNLIKDDLLSLKDKGLGFKTITLIIKEHFHLDIPEQTVRAYCQDVLGFKKNQRKEKKDIHKEEENEDKIKSDVIGGLTSNEEFD